MVRILEPKHMWRRHRVDELGLIIDAEDYYRELYRAALTAKKQILFTGWQFDSDVELLRGATGHRTRRGRSRGYTRGPLS